ncbi:hypothetical protein EDEG_01140 [Edhazardia aedis USNM 41457]|uniref:Uncharacterized protein n=1 Tax=Edhazardia aedis (strain USNM 41457) TaxID=1003232 RepID=J8ZYD5_EDHAE|nr:hypothetical protein EDEG_01140 [Edhazardia aedis USNM 41457]|eukprot:EJW04658.1 hypothetical protein EDEG_01140 [Edhazardia aedis USNM 41457]
MVLLSLVDTFLIVLSFDCTYLFNIFFFESLPTLFFLPIFKDFSSSDESDETSLLMLILALDSTKLSLDVFLAGLPLFFLFFTTTSSGILSIFELSVLSILLSLLSFVFTLISHIFERELLLESIILFKRVFLAGLPLLL